ncbi:MAG: hypothetical protein KJ043_16060 [Anaerolineae bacterium]|nr:hypothetical protein [Anaerolineae bacterium]
MKIGYNDKKMTVNNIIQSNLKDEDEPTDEEIIHDIRQSLKEDLAGDVRREIFADAD